MKLATFAYINNFLSHLSVCVTFFTDLANVPSSRFRVSANCFTINLPKCTRYGCLYLTPPVSFIFYYQLQKITSSGLV